MSFLEPLKLFGEGQYNLNVVKEMEGTDSFLTIDPDVRKCQSTVDYEECTTKHIHDKLKNQCMCLPFNIKQDQVMKDLCIEMLGRFLHMSAWIKHLDFVKFRNHCAQLLKNKNALREFRRTYILTNVWLSVLVLM